MNKKKLLGGNWKLGCTLKSFNIIKDFEEHKHAGIETFIAVPHPFIKTALEKFPPYIKVAAQDCSQFEEGPYTGETSAKIIKELGAEYVLIGHSERRKWFNETGGVLKKKVFNALKAGLKVVFLVGESLDDRESNKEYQTVESQLEDIDEFVGLNEAIDIGYEPVWAVGSGKIPTNDQILSMVKRIKEWGKGKAFVGRVIYGGSVNMLNCQSLLSIRELDGLLVGGSSLSLDFNSIAETFKN